MGHAPRDESRVVVHLDGPNDQALRLVAFCLPDLGQQAGTVVVASAERELAQRVHTQVEGLLRAPEAELVVCRRAQDVEDYLLGGAGSLVADESLFDHSGSVRLALSAWLGDETVADDGRLVEGWFASEQKHYQEWEAGRISFQEQRRRRLRDVYALLGWPCPPDDEVDALFSASPTTSAPGERSTTCTPHSRN